MAKNKWQKKFVDGKLEIVLENNNSTKIIKDNRGYFLITENTAGEQIGYTYDPVEDVVDSANQKLEEEKMKEKNLALISLIILIKEIESSGKEFDKDILDKLIAGKNLPSSYIPQYLFNTIPESSFDKLWYSCEDKLFSKFVQAYHKIISIDPRSQSGVTSFSSTGNGRQTTVEKLIGIKAVNEKGKMVFKKAGFDNKVFETFETFNKDKLNCNEINCNGLTISISNYGIDCSIDLIFVNGKPYIILNDRENNFHDVVLSDKNVLKNLKEDYGINVMECFGGNKMLKKKINEAFGDPEGEDSPFSMSGDEGEDDSSDSPFSMSGDEEDNQNEENEEVNDIIEEIDPEIEKEIEIIDSNIEKIQNLPDDIRENESIQEIYLLLLGKRELIQLEHDDEKSGEIIDNIISDIQSELGEIDNVFKNDNSDSNEIKVEEGKVIEFEGTLIKPMISSTFGNKKQYLILEKDGSKTKHEIKGKRSIKLIIENIKIPSVKNSELTLEENFQSIDELSEIIMSNDKLMDEIIGMDENSSVISPSGFKVTIKELLNACGVF